MPHSEMCTMLITQRQQQMQTMLMPQSSAARSAAQILQRREAPTYVYQPVRLIKTKPAHIASVRLVVPSIVSIHGSSPKPLCCRSLN